MEEGNKDTVKHSSCDPQFELEKQLHEQYAINNNAHIGSFITFFIALLSLFGSFGYVYVHSSTDSTKCGIITLDVFFLFSIVVAGMLFFLSLIIILKEYWIKNKLLFLLNSLFLIVCFWDALTEQLVSLSIFILIQILGKQENLKQCK